MAKESTSLTVAPADEQMTIELYQTFGWELQSSQEIFNKESHLESNGDTINSVTTTTNYVKLMFQREKTMPNYNRLVELENQFHSIANPVQKSAKGIFILAGIAALAGVGMLETVLVGGVIALVAAVALLVIGFNKKKKNTEEYNAEYSAAVSKRQEILDEAEGLV